MTNPTNPRQTDEDRELIEFLTANGKTHTNWAAWFEANPDKEAEYVATGEWDDAKEHRRLEGGYHKARARLESLLSDKAKLEERVRVLEDLPRLIELQRTAAPEHDRDDGWNAGLERAAAMVVAALNNKSGQSST